MAFNEKRYEEALERRRDSRLANMRPKHRPSKLTMEQDFAKKFVKFANKRGYGAP